ncbi:hypothetical protein GX51_03157 [Blastomyces parvus]|uniref:Uncharacterized protein n=1 Tax=Blastomyces parvus TaxID=2060905 RepID=A0A2B7X838_9EURO|nr:hypothetical protein GX51_03157 [Blastomyces parvus]
MVGKSSTHIVRLNARKNVVTFTSGLALTYLQVNLISLLWRYAEDFRLLWQRNPVPCPLLAESRSVGKYSDLESWMTNTQDGDIAAEIDLRTDAPRYMMYRGRQPGQVSMPRYTRRVDGGPCRIFDWMTKAPLCPACVFTQGTFVISMRPYALEQIDDVRTITRPYVATHGEPIPWGWDAVCDWAMKISTVQGGETRH